MTLLSHNSETLKVLTKFCNQKPSKYKNLVKICNELHSQKSEKTWYGFSDRTHTNTGWSDLIPARGQPILEN